MLLAQGSNFQASVLTLIVRLLLNIWLPLTPFLSQLSIIRHTVFFHMDFDLS
jgi:hypothetical protein